MATIAVIGAGAAGLSAATGLRRSGHDVVVLEAADRAGGVIRSERRDGVLADFGPNSMLSPPPAMQQVLDELGISGTRLAANAAARRRYIVRDGVPRSVPATPMEFIGTPLLSAAAKSRLVFEPLQPQRVSAAEESLASLVRRRFGQEFVDYVLDPIVAGIYAGDPQRLSSSHALPVLATLEARHRSVLRGAMQAARDQRLVKGAQEGTMFSFANGMQSMTDAMADGLDRALQLSTTVTGLQPRADGWDVLTARGENRRSWRVDAVVCTAPAHALPGIAFGGALPDAWARLATITYHPVAVVVMSFRREQVAHALDGFGVLVPAREGGQTLGTLFSSTLFPGRAPAGQVALTTFTGGARHPALALAPAAEIQRAVLDDLQRLLGVRGTPLAVVQHSWRKAIPQYEIGYAARLADMDQLEQANAGLFLAGSYRNGVAVGEVMTSGYLAAQAASRFVADAHARVAVG